MTLLHEYGNREFENVELMRSARCADVLRFRPLNQSSQRRGKQTERAPVYERGLCFAKHQKEREIKAVGGPALLF